MIRLALVPCWFFLASLTLVAGGVSGRGGLEAVAVSADGKRLAVGGQNRVVYLIDAATFAVTRRVYIGARVGRLAFNGDGSRLVVEDESDTLHLLNTADGKTLARQTQVAGLVVGGAGGNTAAVRDLSDLAKDRLKLLSLTGDKLKEAYRVELPGGQPAAWHLDATGKQLLVLGISRLDDTERRVPLSEIPRELKGLAREEFRQKYDGLTARLDLLDPSSAVTLAEKKSRPVLRLWYTSDSDSTLLARQQGAAGGQVTVVLNRSNACARIVNKDGTTTLFATPLRFNQGLGVSPNGKFFAAGGIGEGVIGPLDDDDKGKKKMKPTPFQLEPLPGQSELFARFAVRDDGSAWGVTSAYRLVRINKEGRVEKVVPVY